MLLCYFFFFFFWMRAGELFFTWWWRVDCLSWVLRTVIHPRRSVVESSWFKLIVGSLHFTRKIFLTYQANIRTLWIVCWRQFLTKESPFRNSPFIPGSTTVKKLGLRSRQRIISTTRNIPRCASIFIFHSQKGIFNIFFQILFFFLN